MTSKFAPLFYGSLILLIIVFMSSMEWLSIALLAVSLVSFFCFLTSARLTLLSFPGFANSIIFLLYSVITVLFFTANYFTGEGITFDVVTQFNPNSLSAGFYAFEVYHMVALVLLLLFSVIYFVVIYKPQGWIIHIPIWGHVTAIVLMFALHPFVTSAAQLFYRMNNSESSAMVIELIEKNRLTNKEIQEANIAANNANKAKSQFLANMSHELRTPMNAVIGYSEMLEEDAEDQGLDDMIPDLQKIRKAGAHLLSLINDVLDLSKIEADKIELYPERFDASGLLKDIEATATPLFDTNNNRFNFGFFGCLTFFGISWSDGEQSGTGGGSDGNDVVCFHCFIYFC
jgi:signal transduction histidine kinase